MYIVCCNEKSFIVVYDAFLQMKIIKILCIDKGASKFDQNNLKHVKFLYITQSNINQPINYQNDIFMHFFDISAHLFHHIYTIITSKMEEIFRL